ncbi:MAG: Exoribonuclease II [Methanomicrobiales archaeon 53_19]|uniref:RNB domain-containing ribonuclease n=1 Tax=Methanocalculus sp. TaxID=2004547 RepID=UPI00074771F5|nr:RNB domain-containing ribonuclease [Methanocalculus sp.]KUK69839.1 MAG: Exoribonuclease II [Methanocalculus sp. 52_23]KUL04309.1 MAG: Exoribonuclease II [Methanomicrobiales archaeon 53_19]HIJ06065.1 RNB domain-containing ribonuclease [Methanocalculus sp.]
MPSQNPPDLRKLADEAMERYGFSPKFPKNVLSEVERLNDEIIPEERRSARDLRSILWISIDNHDTMDIDQIQFCERGPDDEILVKIAIADVDHLVGKGSATDRHAAKHGTSIYTGVVTYPMLPVRLSEDITSLHPKKDKLAVVIEYAVLSDGSIRHGEIYPAIVRNKAKLVYEVVGEWLENQGVFPYEDLDIPALPEQLLLQHEAAQKMKAERAKQGFLDLETIEASPVMVEGSVTGLVIQQESPAHSLIEEFMISANRTLVARLNERSYPMIQRIVRTPRNWQGIVEEAASYHYRLPADPDVQALASFLIAMKKKDPESFPDLSLTIVKLMGPGEYVAIAPDEDSVGHFALAVTDYTHGTAPNRRYVDIIIQRLIKASLKTQPAPYDIDELTMLAQHLSASEKAAKKVERFMRKAAGAVLLRDRVGETFRGLVTGASEKGTYARIIDPPVEGRVVKNEDGLKVGQRVQVRLLNTDPEKGFIDFERI